MPDNPPTRCQIAPKMTGTRERAFASSNGSSVRRSTQAGGGLQLSGLVFRAPEGAVGGSQTGVGGGVAGSQDDGAFELFCSSLVLARPQGKLAEPELRLRVIRPLR